ncbi:MAG: hypothetical protein LBG15_15940 [Dysgonamonadaceae bacterium]|nr:hypothetical protein [Dysgonamonadaceae bacterium]
MSLALSVAFKELLNSNLLPAFEELMPMAVIEEYVKTYMSHIRNKVYTPPPALCLR